LDDLLQAAAQLDHPLAKLVGRALPVGQRRLAMGEEAGERLAKLFRLDVEGHVQHDLAVLHEDGATGLPEEGVGS
jgi:hypothetical protein